MWQSSNTEWIHVVESPLRRTGLRPNRDLDTQKPPQFTWYVTSEELEEGKERLQKILKGTMPSTYAGRLES